MYLKVEIMMYFGFTSPLKALEHYKKNYDQYGMVISDIRMPEMNGFDLVKNLKD